MRFTFFSAIGQKKQQLYFSIKNIILIAGGLTVTETSTLFGNYQYC